MIFSAVEWHSLKSISVVCTSTFTTIPQTETYHNFWPKILKNQILDIADLTTLITLKFPF